jgi:maltose alpha-D-glucosyltransferase/alpha-amylase
MPYTMNVFNRLFFQISHAESVYQQEGKLDFVRGKGLSGEDINAPISSKALTLSSSNSAMVFGEKYFLKLYRKLFKETNPEVEMIEFLTEHSDFAFIPAFAGSVTWQQESESEITLGMMQRMVDNQADTWEMTGNQLTDFVTAFVDKTFAIKEDVLIR